MRRERQFGAGLTGVTPRPWLWVQTLRESTNAGFLLLRSQIGRFMVRIRKNWILIEALGSVFLSKLQDFCLYWYRYDIYGTLHGASLSQGQFLGIQSEWCHKSHWKLSDQEILFDSWERRCKLNLPTHIGSNDMGQCHGFLPTPVLTIFLSVYSWRNLSQVHVEKYGKYNVPNFTPEKLNTHWRKNMTSTLFMHPSLFKCTYYPLGFKNRQIPYPKCISNESERQRHTIYLSTLFVY